MPQQFPHFANRVRSMLATGAALPVIGAEVDTWPLPAEQRSALWLLAWSSRPARPVATRARDAFYERGAS